MHSLLQRQLRKHFKDMNAIPRECDAFLHAVDEAYHQSDVDRKMLERALDLSSEELLEANQGLRENEEWVRFLIDAMPYSVCLKDGEGRWLVSNTYNLDLFQLQGVSFLGKTDAELAEFSPFYREALLTCRESDEKTWQSGTMTRTEEIIPRPNGETLIFDVIKVPNFHPDGSRRGLVVIARDITEQRRLERELLQARKMEAIGTLAGGIAHDFNNLLMGIQGYVSLMLWRMDKDHPDYEKLRKIEEQVMSGAGLTRQLLGFARRGKYETKPANLNEIIERTVNMFGRTRKEIVIHTQYTPDLWIVEVDRGQIEQVILNLLVNAWQAMPDGGHLFLSTGNVVLSEELTRLQECAPGRYVYLSVTDTGVGMDAQTMERIFDPFFTTKEMRHGTGLGLPSAYGIIKTHGGMITVESEKGQGSTFHIYLPASDKPFDAHPKRKESTKKGEGTILLVDDEPLIIEVGVGLLNLLGYKVIAAADAEEAITLYKRHSDEIDLVLLDMIMPDKGGGEVFDALKEIRPEVKVILTSGYALDGPAREIMGRGCRAFIQKPFTVQDLSQKIHEVLNPA
ncbi:MAG: response regulator [Syntrophobacterales bacterium]|nr:response regulator [Syntrophobacterales bacterium]